MLWLFYHPQGRECPQISDLTDFHQPEDPLPLGSKKSNKELCYSSGRKSSSSGTLNWNCKTHQKHVALKKKFDHANFFSSVLKEVLRWASASILNCTGKVIHINIIMPNYFYEGISHRSFDPIIHVFAFHKT